MTDWQQRLLDEADELAKKISALVAFISSGVYLSLSERERQLLSAQLKYMFDYQYVLSERIAFYKNRIGDASD